MSGKMTTAKKMKIAYFSQHQTEELDVEKTPFEQLGDVMPGASETQIRAQLGAFGLNKAKSDTEIGKLSGGEKSRLLFKSPVKVRQVPPRTIQSVSHAISITCKSCVINTTAPV